MSPRSYPASTRDVTRDVAWKLPSLIWEVTRVGTRVGTRVDTRDTRVGILPGEVEWNKDYIVAIRFEG